MFCNNCGTTIPENAGRCPTCGMPCAPAAPSYAPQDQGYAPQNQGYAPQNQGYAPQVSTYNYGAPSVSPSNILTFGILGIAFACLFVTSFLGIIFSAMAKSRFANYLAQGGQPAGQAKVGSILAKVGFILGIVMTAIFVLYLIILVAALAFY